MRRILKDFLTSFLVSNRRFCRAICFSSNCEATAEIEIGRSFSKNQQRFRLSKNIFPGKYDNYRIRGISDYYLSAGPVCTLRVHAGGLFIWREGAPATRLEGLKHSPPLHATHLTG